VENLTLDLTKSKHPSNLSEQNTWVAIDEPAEWSNFSQALNVDSEEWESHIAIEGMHCAACAINVENALKSVPGVSSADVNATSGHARVVWFAGATKPSNWMRAVSQAGYRALPAADAFIQDSRRKNQRLMLWRLLVAGFCMMQVMMYAMPTYYASPGEMTTEALNLMRWASWVLTLPVLFFSCSPFFSNALNDLKQRQISMDMPVTLGILITFLVSTAATFEPSGWWGSEVYFDSLSMFIFFLLTGRYIELRMRDRTAGALDVLMRRVPSSVERLKSDGSYARVAVRNLKVGDIVRVLPGEAFPADGIIKQGSTNADEALLTGESRAITKTVGSEVIAGSHNLTRAVQVEINQVGRATRYAQIVALMQQVAVDKPRLALLADRIARPFLLAVILAAMLAAAILWHTDHSRALMAAVAVLIVTCPCALSLATPAAMLTVTGALARSGVLVRKMQALEALTTIDTIVFDKTGTLTEDRMTIASITSDKHLSNSDALNLAANLAQNSLHPVSRALVEAAKKHATEMVNAEINHVEEIPGSGLTANSIYGKLKLGSAIFCGLENSHSTQVNHDTSKVYLVSKQGWLATFEVTESVKSDAVSAIRALHASNLHIEVLSGDRAQSVGRVASIVGIQTYFGNCTPQDKLAHIELLQKQGHRVAMVGDGLNDGPVLALANVSIAMGQAVPLAQAQSDFVVLGGQLTMVPILINQAKRTMRIVKQNLIWAAAYNALCVPLAVMGFLPAWLAGLGMALSSLLVVLNAARLSRRIAPIEGVE
jgi:P-type Cu2+ transporter